MSLSVEKVERSFGGVHALDGVSFAVRDGEVHGLIGPKGAGKPTLPNVVSGPMRPPLWRSAGAPPRGGGGPRGGKRRSAAPPPPKPPGGECGGTFQNIRL